MKNEMKKIFVAIFAAVALLAGCAKEAPVAESQDVKVTFSVTDKDGFGADTKAVKAGWEVGDEIVLIFHSGTEWLDYSNGNNTVKLTKTAGGWSADASKVALASLTGEKYFAVHHLGQMTLGSVDGTRAEFTNYKGGEYLTAHGTYSTNGTNLDLGTVAMTRNPTLSQFSVKDLTIENNDSWDLYIYAIVDGQKVVTGQVQQCGLSSMMLICGSSEPTIGRYKRWYADGIQNGSDVSFCFDDLASSNYEGSDLCFKLERTGTGGIQEFYYRSTTKKLADFDGHAFSLPSLESEKWKTTFEELL